jgi:hypothetical protein
MAIKFTMKPGFEVTEEIKNIANRYDFYYRYIENYGQMVDQERANDKIKDQLTELGVEKFEQVK